MKAKHYPNLHKVSWSPNWVFRKFSSVKKREFVKSTGLEATEKNAALAYKRGMDLFDTWLGSFLPSGRTMLVRDLAKRVLASKDGKRKATQSSSRNQLLNHVIPAFGHLRPEQVTSTRWKNYDALERKKGKRSKLFNTRKALRECLTIAKEEGLIQRVPKLKSFDPDPAPPKYIEAKAYRSIRRAVSEKVGLLAFTMYQQGPRPQEALQYRKSMVRWTLGPYGSIEIPGAITKTGRARIIPLNRKVSRVYKYLAERVLEGDCFFPSRDDPNEPIKEYRGPWDRAMSKLGYSYTIYNLRDTFITNKLKQGLSSTFIGKYCDTSATMIEKKYAVAEDEIMRRLAE